MKHTLFFVTTFFAAAAALALEVGDEAPALDGVTTWYNGDAPDPSARGSIHVVEFWATWCPPCRTSIPHLNQLHKNFKDQGVIIAGISNETTDKVQPFMKKTEMLYRVGVDPDNSTAKTYMKGVGGIPHAFIVNRDGIVVWQGHPLNGLDDALAQVVDGTWNLDKARAVAEAAGATERIQQEMMEALQAGELDKAIGLLDDLAKADPDDAAPYLFKMQLLFSSDQGEAARKTGREAVKRFHDQAEQLNEIAWAILESPTAQRDLATALDAADRALALTGNREAPVLDTAALAAYYLGDLEKAVALQTSAAEIAGEAGDPEIQATLEYYQSVISLRDTRGH